MKTVSWFIQNIGVKVNGSKHNEPFTIENGAHAHNLFVLQQSENETFELYVEAQPEPAKEVPKEPTKKPKK
jgi:hypothetical protein